MIKAMKGCSVVLFLLVVVSSSALFAAKPIALTGNGADVVHVKADVIDQLRLKSVDFSNRWLAPSEYHNYAAIYFGEKLAHGEYDGKSWKDPADKAAVAAYLDAGGVIIVGAGPGLPNTLLGKPDRKHPEPLRDRLVVLNESLGRKKINFMKAKKPLSFPDEAGNDILTDEGRAVKALTDRYLAAFKAVKDVEVLPPGEKWETVPLGAPGSLKPPTRLARRPVLGKPAPRKDGLTILDGATKAVIVVTPDLGKDVANLADELRWHLEQMTGETFAIVDTPPEKGPALVYRRVACPQDFPRGRESYFRIAREGDRLVLGGEAAGFSRATTYVLEALGCRYVWPGATGKVIPKKARVVLPEIAVEDATPLVVRRVRLYGFPEWIDRAGNRDFWRWHGLNDNALMTTEKPGDGDGYEWGHYYRDYYPKYAKSKPGLFALQPDGTRELHLGTHTERPTFCLSNPELAEITARRKLEEFAAKPGKKCLSICLPDGATSSWCMCPKCRAMDPVNSPTGSLTVYYPERRSVPYVSFTDRVFAYMNAVCEKVVAEKPDAYLSCYAYSCYTAAPVKVVPHRNLIVLSVAGNYADAKNDGAVESNLAAWMSFGNRVLWRPNAHGGFRVLAPDNFARRMFADVSLLCENGLFGVDYDTMYSDWAMKCFTFYLTAKAHFNPDRLDFDSLAEDYARAAFGLAWKEALAYFAAVEAADDRAAAANAADGEKAVNWEQRQKRANRLFEKHDFDSLDRCLAAARTAAQGDEAVLFRLGRLQFANDVGRFMRQLRLEQPAAPTDAEKHAFALRVRAYAQKDPAAGRMTGNARSSFGFTEKW